MNSCFFSFFVAHQHFYSAVNLPGPECNFSPRCWIAFVCTLLLFFLCICAFLPQKSPPHLLDLHRRCNAKVPPCINGIDKLKGEVLHYRLAGAGGADACNMDVKRMVMSLQTAS